MRIIRSLLGDDDSDGEFESESYAAGNDRRLCHATLINEDYQKDND